MTIFDNYKGQSHVQVLGNVTPHAQSVLIERANVILEDMEDLSNKTNN